jgi:hypothetical protein
MSLPENSVNIIETLGGGGVRHADRLVLNDVVSDLDAVSIWKRATLKSRQKNSARLNVHSVPLIDPEPYPRLYNSGGRIRKLEDGWVGK